MDTATGFSVAAESIEDDPQSSKQEVPLCDLKKNLQKKRDDLNEAKRKFMQESFPSSSPEHQPITSTRSSSRPASRGSSPPPLPASLPPLPSSLPPQDSEGENKNSEISQKQEDRGTADTLARVPHEDRAPTPPAILKEFQDDPFSCDFEDNISTDIALSDGKASPIEHNLDSASSDEDILTPSEGVFFSVESSGTIDIGGQTEEGTQLIDTSRKVCINTADITDESLVEVIEFEPEEYIDCLIDSDAERDPREEHKEYQHTQVASEHCLLSPQRRGNSPAFIDQLKSSEPIVDFINDENCVTEVLEDACLSESIELEELEDDDANDSIIENNRLDNNPTVELPQVIDSDSKLLSDTEENYNEIVLDVSSEIEFNQDIISTTEENSEQKVDKSNTSIEENKYNFIKEPIFEPHSIQGRCKSVTFDDLNDTSKHNGLNHHSTKEEPATSIKTNNPKPFVFTENKYKEPVKDSPKKTPTNVDFLFPDISSLLMKVNMKKPEPPIPLDTTIMTPPSYRRSRSYDVEPMEDSSDEEYENKIRIERPIDIRDYTIANSIHPATTTTTRKSEPNDYQNLDNNDNKKSVTKRAPPPLMKKPSMDATSAVLAAARQPNGRPLSLQATHLDHPRSSGERPQSTPSGVIHRNPNRPTSLKPIDIEDISAVTASVDHHHQQQTTLMSPYKDTSRCSSSTINSTTNSISNSISISNTSSAEFTISKADADIEVDDDGNMKILAKQQSIFMNTDQYSPEIVIKSPAPILDKSATFKGFFNQAPKERVASPTLISPPASATPPTPRRIVDTPPTPHRVLDTPPAIDHPTESQPPPQQQQQQKKKTKKKSMAPLPPVRHSELMKTSSESLSTTASRSRCFDFVQDNRTDSMCSSLSDRPLSPSLTTSSGEPRPLTPATRNYYQRPRNQPPSPPRIHSEDYLEVNVRQAQQLASQAIAVRRSQVAESDSGCFLTSPDRPNMTEASGSNSVETSDIDDIGANICEEDSYFSEEESSLQRNNYNRRDPQSTSDLNMVPTSTATMPTEYSTDTITRHQSNKDTRFETVSELLVSERSYVDRLHFLCRVIVLNLKVLSKLPGDISPLPYDIIEKTFPCIEAIFNFHACTLLPRLEDRILDWKRENYIYDIMTHLCKILPMYQKFVAKVNQSLKNLDTYRNTNVVFSRLMEEAEKVAECRRLPIKQHLLDITNRVSMYRDFLLEYERNLPVDDIKDSLQQLKDMSHSIQRFMGKEDRLLELQNMQKRLDTDVNFVTPTNELIKEGYLKSVSTQGNKRAPRYVFLLNEALLLCTTAGALSNKHQIKCIAVVDGLQIFGGDNLMLAHTFYVQGKRHTIELQASSAEQKHEWIMRIREMIDSFTAKKLCASVSVNYEVKPEEIGKYKPEKSTTNRITSCSLCGANFRSTRRKHHCKACGQVICANCCCQKARLEYCEFRLSKVCDECYVIIRKVELTQGADLWSDNAVQAYDQGMMSGFVQLSNNNGHTWVKRWLTVHRDRVLYCFKTETDEKPYTSLPIRRFQVSITTKDDAVHKNNSFKIFNMKRTYFIVADDSKALLSWLKALNDLQEST